MERGELIISPLSGQGLDIDAEVGWRFVDSCVRGEVCSGLCKASAPANAVSGGFGCMLKSLSTMDDVVTWETAGLGCAISPCDCRTSVGVEAIRRALVKLNGCTGRKGDRFGDRDGDFVGFLVFVSL